jgi:hypothetical protein
MRKPFAIFAVICLVAVFYHPVFAQNASNEAASALSVDDAEKLRQQMKALASLLSAKVPQDSVHNAGVKSSKTVGDALDKALDLVSGSVATIAAGVEKVAPHVWRIMIVQQYANAVGDLLLPLGLFILVVVYYRVIGKKWIKPTKPDGTDNYGYQNFGPNFAWWTFSRVLPIFFGLIFGIWGMANISGSVKMLINPEYYAIKDLIAIILQNNPF